MTYLSFIYCNISEGSLDQLDLSTRIERRPRMREKGLESVCSVTHAMKPNEGEARLAECKSD